MKILILSNDTDSLYRFRKELIRKLANDNEVFISVPSGAFCGRLRALNAKVVVTDFGRRDTNPIEELMLQKKYISLLKQIKPDVVLTYTIKPNVYGGIACQICGIPYISNITGLGTSIQNGGLLSIIAEKLYKVGLRKAACVFFQNMSNHKLFTGLKITKGKTRLIPGSGVNLNDYPFFDYPKDNGQVNFLFVGRIMRDKGINELLGAIRIVKQKYPKVTLDVIGGCDEDYEERLASEENSGFIRYLKTQTSARDFMKNSSCIVLPSYHEGISNVLLEAAALGRPVIASLVPGCQETFNDGVTGLGCEAKNTASLAEKMIQFIELPHEAKAQMGYAARKKIEKEYDRNVVINAYLEEIAEISKGKR